MVELGDIGAKAARFAAKSCCVLTCCCWGCGFGFCGFGALALGSGNGAGLRTLDFLVFPRTTEEPKPSFFIRFVDLLFFAFFLGSTVFTICFVISCFKEGDPCIFARSTFPNCFSKLEKSLKITSRNIAPTLPASLPLYWFMSLGSNSSSIDPRIPLTIFTSLV